jgi:hypothetical protein
MAYQDGPIYNPRTYQHQQRQLLIVLGNTNSNYNNKNHHPQYLPDFLLPVLSSSIPPPFTSCETFACPRRPVDLERLPFSIPPVSLWRFTAWHQAIVFFFSSSASLGWVLATGCHNHLLFAIGVDRIEKNSQFAWRFNFFWSFSVLSLLAWCFLFGLDWEWNGFGFRTSKVMLHFGWGLERHDGLGSAPNDAHGILLGVQDRGMMIVHKSEKEPLLR